MFWVFSPSSEKIQHCSVSCSCPIHPAICHILIIRAELHWWTLSLGSVLFNLLLFLLLLLLLFMYWFFLQVEDPYHWYHDQDRAGRKTKKWMQTKWWKMAEVWRREERIGGEVPEAVCSVVWGPDPAHFTKSGTGQNQGDSYRREQQSGWHVQTYQWEDIQGFWPFHSKNKGLGMHAHQGTMIKPAKLPLSAIITCINFMLMGTRFFYTHTSLPRLPNWTACPPPSQHWLVLQFPQIWLVYKPLINN